MTEMKWEDPPGAKRGEGAQGKHIIIAAELRGRPGAWARVATYRNQRTAGSIAYGIRKGIQRAYEPAGAFEAVSRSDSEGYQVYARYVGVPEDE